MGLLLKQRKQEVLDAVQRVDEKARAMKEALEVRPPTKESDKAAVDAIEEWKEAQNALVTAVNTLNSMVHA